MKGDIQVNSEELKHTKRKYHSTKIKERVAKPVKQK